MSSFSQRLASHIPSRESSTGKERQSSNADQNQNQYQNQNQVNDRLARARIEGKRRELNQLRKQHQHQHQHQHQLSETSLSSQNASSSSHSASASARSSTAYAGPSPIASSFHSTSASSRAGLLYFSSTSLSSAEAEQKERNRLLKRQVAGPVPPGSWQDDFDQRRVRQEARAGRTTAATHQSVLTESGVSEANSQKTESWISTMQDPLKVAQARRRHLCSSTRTLFSSTKHPSHSFKTSRLPSLSDLSLCSVIDSLNAGVSFDPRSSSSSQLDYQALLHLLLIEEVFYVPTHLKLRMSELAGRESRSLSPLCWNGLRSLWSERGGFKDDGKEKKVERDSKSRDERALEKDTLEEPSENWDDSDSSSEQEGNPAPTSSPETLDLSFSHLSSRNLRSLLHLNGNRIINANLRELSLAGWGSQLLLESNQGAFGSPLLLGSSEALSIFSSLPNLKVLSLAHTNLRPLIRTRHPNSRFSISLHPSIETPSPQLLSKISKVTPRLEKLDLGDCDWVDSRTISGVNWSNGITNSKDLKSSDGSSATAWDELKVLVLRNCQAFTSSLLSFHSSRSSSSPPSTPSLSDEDEEELGERVGLYLSPWHSEYHSNLKRNPLHRIVRDENSRRRARTQLSSDPQVLSAFGRENQGDSIDEIPALTTSSAFSSSFPTRCPITGERIEPCQWERARTLDSIRGRNRAWMERIGHEDEKVKGSQHLALDRNFVEVFF